MRALRAVAVALLVCAVPGASSAQDSDLPVGVLATYSTGSSSPMQDPIRLSTVDFELVMPMSEGPGWGVEYAPALAMAFVANNPNGVVEQYGGGWVVWNPPPTSRNFGFGLRPANVRLWIGGHRVKLEADASGGFLWFGKPLLAANATRFNFTGSVGFGLRLELPDGARTVVGFRVHHASNGGLGDVNPGIDSRQVYVGIWLR